MTTPNDDSKPENVMEQPLPPPPAIGDLENQTPQVVTPAGGGGISNIIRRWKNGDRMKRGSLASRGFGFVFSLLAFVIMASNKHGDWTEFDRYEEYRYVVAIAILSTLYTGFQVFKEVRQLSTGREMFSSRNLPTIDFFGDQIVAYLLISAASSAVPITNRMREGADNIFTDSSASAISMEFFAFFSLAVSALISGYNLSNRTYV